MVVLYRAVGFRLVLSHILAKKQTAKQVGWLSRCVLPHTLALPHTGLGIWFERLCEGKGIWFTSFSSHPCPRSHATQILPWAKFAERGGFEPPLPCGKHAFQACAFNHSATSPFQIQRPKESLLNRSRRSGSKTTHCTSIFQSFK